MVSPLKVDEAVATGVCTPVTLTPIAVDEAAALAGRLKALAEPTRLRLLSLIASHESHEACVCDLTGPVGLSQPTVSHHLKILVDAGFLTRSKRGSWAFYALVPDAFGELRAATDAFGIATSGTRGAV